MNTDPEGSKPYARGQAAGIPEDPATACLRVHVSPSSRRLTFHDSVFECIAQGYTCEFAEGPLTAVIGRLSGELAG